MAGRKRDGPRKQNAFEKFINQIRELDSFKNEKKTVADCLENIQKKYKFEMDEEYLEMFRIMMEKADELRATLPNDFIICLRVVLIEELFQVNWDRATATNEFLEKIIRIFIFGFCMGYWDLPGISEEEEK